MIATYVVCGLLAILAIIISIFIGIEYNYGKDGKSNLIVSVLVGIVIAFAIMFAGYWWLNNTAAGQRAIKDTHSNLNNGIERIVTIYDINGNQIKKYDGQMDIEMHDTYIVFDEAETGLRHIVFFTTGTVIVDEK